MRIERIILLLALVATTFASAQTGSQKESLLLNATVQNSPGSITLTWSSPNGASGYTIYRKLKTDNSWGNSIGSAGSGATSYTDNGVSVGTYYEYKVVQAYSGGTAYGYIAAGVQVPATDYRGKLVLLVDNTFITSAATQLTQLEADLKADGWVVLRSNVDRSASVSSVRGIIQGYYNADPSNVKAVYIIGHLAVPYAGNINPDGHGDHLGAWPCDGYYGDMNGTWSDNSVNSTGGQNSRNHNSPGDGKFDNSDFPSALELQVGRVDFYEFESFQYYAGLSENQLTINYLNKAHQFKAKLFTPTYRGCVFNNFDDLSYTFAGSGYRSISANVGTSNLTDLNPNGAPFSTYVDDQSWLWTYACGGGTWSGADNVGSTGEYANNIAMGGVFNMAFGSYFGDWNTFNNFLKAPLGSGKALTNVFAGIPNWWFQHMAMGDNIGYSTLVSMNNTSLYVPQNPGWQGNPYSRVHMGLMGDPSLRQVMVPMPGNLQVSNSGGLASFAWNAASGVDGYYVYDMGASGGIPVRVSPNLVTGTSFSNAAVPFVAGRQYMVRSVKLETAPTGTYYNLSLGVLATASGQASADCAGVVGGTATVGSACNDNNACTTGDVYNASCQCVGTAVSSSVTLTAYGPTSFCSGGGVLLGTSAGSGNTYQWKRDGNVISGATGSSYTATQGGSFTVTMNNGGCGGTSNAVAVTVSTAPTATLSAGGGTTFCNGGSVTLSANTGSGLTYVWQRNGTTISGATGSSYSATQAGSYVVLVSSGACSTTSSAVSVTVTSGPTATLTAAGSVNFCSGGSVVLNANTGSGYTYVWKKDGTTITGATASSYTATQPGTYTAVVSSGSCSSTSNGITVTNSSGAQATLTAYGPTGFCAGGGVLLGASTGSGYSYVWKRDGNTLSGITGSTYTATQTGSYTAVVSNGGCSSTSNAIAVTAPSAPSATIAASGVTTFCSGGSVTLNANTGSGLTYVWNRNGSLITGATGSSYAATQAGNYTVVVNNGGCATTSAATTVTVTSGVSATISAAGPVNFCVGGSVVLNANTGSGLSYVWKRNGTTITGATGSSYTATQAGDHTVTVTSGTCNATSSAITVSNSVGGQSTLTPYGPTSFCAGGGVLLGANTGSGLSYVWKRNGNTISGVTGSTYTANQTGDYTVTVSNGGCASVSNAVSVTSASQPTANITAAGQATFCEGGSVVLNATSGSGYTYVWKRSGTTIGGAVSSSFTAVIAGTYTVIVSNGGCASTSSGLNVTTLVAPVVSCSANNGAATVSASASGGQPPYSYSWNTNPVQTASTASIAEGGTYAITVTGVNGCSAACAVSIDLPSGTACTGTRTEGQGAWGGTSNTAASYMTTNFASAFPAPAYLTIGCGGRRLRLTSAAAVSAFLPSSGTSNQLLYGLWVDPGTSVNSQFAGELVALKLSIRFDEINPVFSASSVLLKDMVIASGPFTDWTVAELVAEADKKIGSCNSSYTRAALKQAIMAVNSGYQGGSQNSGFLQCPPENRSVAWTPDEEELIAASSDLELTVLPNPFHGNTTIVVEGVGEGERVTAEIWTVEGVLLERIIAGDAAEDMERRMRWDASNRAAGLYICRVMSGSRTAVAKLRVE